MLKESAAGQLKIYLHGRFRVEGPEGENLTPVGSKDCGLIALLITSQHGDRTRAWLQSKLWSDRGAEQAANSLRQSIAKIRKALGDYHSVFQSNRQHVAIDLDKFEIQRDPRFEFLEGIDVRDEEFEEWLTVERSDQTVSRVQLMDQPRLLQRNTAYPNIVLIYDGHRNIGQPSSSWIGQIVGDMASRSISESFDIPISRFPTVADQSNAWCIEIEANQVEKQVFVVRLALIEGSSGRVIWSANRNLDRQDGDLSENEELVALTQELTSAFGAGLVDSMPETDLLNRADALCVLGVQRLFSMESRQIDNADTLFSRAYEVKPRGLYLAWRAHVREIQLVERISPDRRALKDESEALIRRAFESEPNNSMVLALLSINRLHVASEIDTALQYALRAVKMNYSNAMAWWALSAAHLKSENPAKSYSCARMAVKLSLGTPIEFWTQSQLSGAAMAVRKLSEAKMILKNVSFARPDFRPPLRYLVTLHATDEEWTNALATAERLKDLEPGFSMDQLANDKDYPVSLLHQPYGLDRERVLSLI